MVQVLRYTWIVVYLAGKAVFSDRTPYAILLDELACTLIPKRTGFTLFFVSGTRLHLVHLHTLNPYVSLGIRVRASD